jgi:fumarate reductase flavoprotein subunit
MGGVICNVDTSTEKPGLFVAGEDASGMHGANRLGGNGVANSTVFGAVAGDTMADWVRREGRLADPLHVDDAIARCERPLRAGKGDLESIRERLYDTMWERVGIIRDARGLTQAARELGELDAELDGVGIGGDRAFNLSWHDWLNLKNLVAVSQVIARTALAREDSRGAHFREDFPEAGPLDTSAFTSIRNNGEVTMKPVAFTRVRPGQTILKPAGPHAS